MRIIAGQAKGTRLKTPANVTRPTADKVRGAIFSMLQDIIPHSNILDLFAGTGAMGLEALSRGASQCLFIESDSQAARILQDNLTTTKLSSARIQTTDALTYLKSTSEHHDLIFADPPYARNGNTDFASLLLEKPLPLTPEGYLILETESERPTPTPDHLRLIKRKDYGGTSVLIFQNTTASS
ncbi:MAG: 16S rRNA (guanine(966)-N(2))-methyltransferase RsmD [Verrucomicrobiota bacterium]